MPYIHYTREERIKQAEWLLWWYERGWEEQKAKRRNPSLVEKVRRFINK